MGSLVSRDSMLPIAGFPETSYPWLRFHRLHFCSTFTLFNVLDSVFTFCALQPNKVYIGGLPENTRQEDLQSCFGKIGSIVNIELKYVSLNSLKAIPDPIHFL
jgi:RNA recognition motif. (a.k.a. RRM, RBD, or RNP domain)